MVSTSLSSKRQRKDYRETKDKEEVGRRKNGKVWKHKYLESKREIVRRGIRRIGGRKEEGFS